MRRQQANRRQVTAVGIVLGGVLLLCCAVSLVGWAVSRTPTSQPAASGSGTVAVDPRSAKLTIAYSPEKAALIKGLADRFNGQNLRTPDGQRMQVELMELTPEDMVNQALAGAAFQALSPVSSRWLDQLNRRWAQSQQSQPVQIAPRLAFVPLCFSLTP